MITRADDGCVLWTESVGHGRPLVLCHGGPGLPDTAAAHAEALADPWLGINRECSAAVNEDVRAWLQATDLAARCRELPVPVMIVDGECDLRPRWAVDSLHRALPRARRVALRGAGHLPWVEDPGGFRAAVAGFLAGPPGGTVRGEVA